MYRETGVINKEAVAVLKGIQKRPGNMACIHVCRDQETKAYHYASLGNIHDQHLNHTSIHFLKNVKGQKCTDLLPKQNAGTV